MTIEEIISQLKLIHGDLVGFAYIDEELKLIFHDPVTHMNHFWSQSEFNSRSDTYKLMDHIIYKITSED